MHYAEYYADQVRDLLSFDKHEFALYRVFQSVILISTCNALRGLVRTVSAQFPQNFRTKK